MVPFLTGTNMNYIGKRLRLPTLWGVTWLPVFLMPTSSSAAPDKNHTAGQARQQTTATTKPKSAKEQKAQPESFVLVGAGDIVGCSSLAGAAATAKLIEQIPGTVFAAGDLAYEHGTAEEFQNCYDATWGKFKDRTRPAPGNHEYYSQDGKVYFEYWGERAGPAGKGYYSYDLGNWHVIALNTNCDAPGVGGCGAGSDEEKWLREDLAAHPKSCILAYGHHALYSSGIFKRHAIHPELREFWRDLYAAHADLMLGGHEHSYERFAPQDPDGHLDPQNGMREIVVGTGGRSHHPLGMALPNSEVRNSDSFGVLKFDAFAAELHLAVYSCKWRGGVP